MDRSWVLKTAEDILKDRIPGLWNTEDLVTRWKNAPAKRSTNPVDPHESEVPDRRELLKTAIDDANEYRWAREELRDLVRYLLNAGEKIPKSLSDWVHHEYAGLNPAVRRGRPTDKLRVARFRATCAWLRLWLPEFSQEDAIAFIAEREPIDIETVRPIVRMAGPKAKAKLEELRKLMLQITP